MSSFTYKSLDEKYLNKFKEWFPRIFSCEFSPGKFIVPKEYSHVAQNILDFNVCPDDVFVVSYPRTGSTWSQEIVWLIVNDLNFDLAKSIPQLQRSPLIELPAYYPEGFNEGNPLQPVLDLSAPRCIKSHCPYDLLPKEIETVKPKVVYTMRNPKDVWCSYYSFHSAVMRMDAPFDEAAKYFCEGKMPFGSYLNHCLKFWEKRKEPNILILQYEETWADTKKTIKDVANFLEKPLTDDQVDAIYDFVQFDNMKNSSAVNLDQFAEVNTPDFIRKGKVGGWKNKLSEETSKMFDEWVKKEIGESGIEFIYEL